MRFVFEFFPHYKESHLSAALSLQTRISLSLSLLQNIMKRNCNLELRLLTPSASFHFSDHRSAIMEDSSPNKTQQLTIFYKGEVAACDATELQARAIISLASRETEEKPSKNSAAAALNSPVYSAATGMSMKRSLQRFLEKRKGRAQSISPYAMTRR